MTDPAADEEGPAVLVVGGGPVGLSLAIELRAWGVPTLVAERRAPNALTFPTANHLSNRTVELMRRWGLATRARQAGFPTDWGGAVGVLTHIGGYEVAHLPRRCADDPARRSFSPETELWQPKRFFDPVLRAAAVERGADVRSNVEVTALRQDVDGVTAELTDLSRGNAEEIRTAFVVGCDGARSRVRGWIDAALEGPPAGDPIESVYFRSSELASLLPRDRWQYRLLGRADGPDAHGWMLITIDGERLWRLHGPNIVVDGDPQATAAGLRRLIGADVDVEVLSTSTWQPRQALCRNFRRGRIFLAGDAAARGSTFGGMWMNRGIADAVDLGWKLGAVLAGWGQDALLESYTDERRRATLDLLRFQGVDLSGPEPVVINERSFGHAGLIPDPPIEFWHDTEEGEARRSAVRASFASIPEEQLEWPRADLGYRYDGSPTVVDDDPPQRLTDEWADYEQTSKPGGRAPHVWLDDDRSSLDWFGQWFTLVVGANGDPATIVAAARERCVPLRVEAPESTIIEEAYGRELTLVRPDGFVAWSDRSPSSSAALRIIDTVRGA